jgi:hypothetical protein
MRRGKPSKKPRTPLLLNDERAPVEEPAGAFCVSPKTVETMEASMAQLISQKSRPKQDHGGDKAPPLTPLAETKALAKASLKFHPFAAKFPLMEGKEFDELVKDVSTNGLIEPIIMHDGEILDGRNRYRACLKSKVEPIFEPFSGNDPLAFVISANIHRRHLTLKLKRKIIADLLKAAPEKSNRQIADMVKAHHATVGVVRDKLESTGQIDQLEKTKGADGKSRKAKRPTSKSTSKSKSKPVADDRPEPKDGKNESIQSLTPVEVESPPSPPPQHAGDSVPVVDRRVANTVINGPPKLDSLAWLGATETERQRFVSEVGLAALFAAATPQLVTGYRTQLLALLGTAS